MNIDATDVEEAAFQVAMKNAAKATEAALDKLLPQSSEVTGIDGEAELIEAMRYATLQGGKRMRAFLVMECASLFSQDPESAARVAAAVECIHAYSLVHDDLPSMDDDPVRRGRPSTHCAFDEATAILAGDALQACAFEILSASQTHEDPFVRCELVKFLAHAAGAAGMVGGQARDIAAETASQPVQVDAVTRTQRLKTGALIEFSCLSGAIMARAGEAQFRALEGYSHDLGLAFQIRDDLLDVEGIEKETGKKLRKDKKTGKVTFLSLMEKDEARAHADMLVQQAISHLRIFGSSAKNLCCAAKYAVKRWQ